MTDNLRFGTNNYKIYDHYKEEEYLVNCVDADDITTLLNNLDLKARNRSKALSKLQLQYNDLEFEHQNTLNVLDDFINIVNRLQAHPNDSQILNVAKDMLLNMNVVLQE